MATPKGGPTAAQLAALEAGRPKGQAVTRARAAKARARKAANPNAKSRHQMLLDGELKVADLDNEELRRWRGRDVDGEFKGRIAPIPAKIREQMRQRLLSIMQAGFESFMPQAQALLEDIAENGDSDAARLKAIDMMLQRAAGKVPDTLRIGVEDPWEAVLKDALDGMDDVEAGKARERLARMKQGRTEDAES